MCHEPEARPPVPPGEPGVVAHTGELELVAEDGNVFVAYQAVPEQDGGPAVVLLPDMRGLHDFYRDLARRFAGAGIAALAIDYHDRIAAKDLRGAGLDARAAIDHLASEGRQVIYSVGFCVGGAISWSRSAVDDRIAGAVGFYGVPAECRALIPEMRAPLLVLAAGADVLTSAEEAHRFDRELTEHGVPHTFVLYDGAPHSFFDGGLPDQAAACADAWQRVLDFVGSR